MHFLHTVHIAFQSITGDPDPLPTANTFGLTIGVVLLRNIWACPKHQQSAEAKNPFVKWFQKAWLSKHSGKEPQTLCFLSGCHQKPKGVTPGGACLLCGQRKERMLHSNQNIQHRGKQTSRELSPLPKWKNTQRTLLPCHQKPVL